MFSFIRRLMDPPPDDDDPNEQPADYYPTAPHDVYAAAWALQHFLPWELVKYTVDLAEYWPRLSVMEEEYLRIHQRQSPQAVAALPITVFRTRRAQPVRKIVFTITAHDQGWVSDPNAGTWTWFDALLVPNDRSEHLVHRLATNELGNGKWQTHSVTWLAEDMKQEAKEGECKAEVMRAMQEGAELQVVAHAQFPGWVNHVRDVSIEAFVGVLH